MYVEWLSVRVEQLLIWKAARLPALVEAEKVTTRSRQEVIKCL